MKLCCDSTIASVYKSNAHIARVVSETWLAANGYCVACNSDHLISSAANTKCTDFICNACGQAYELKTFQRRPAFSLIDGAYSPLMSRIMGGTAPALLLLQRNALWKVEELTVVHPLFLTPPVIERRAPLGPNAVRAGWVGCNIRLDRIGSDGEIRIVHQGREMARNVVRKQFRRFLTLSDLRPTDRGWTVLTISVIRDLSKRTFVLPDLYDREQLFRTCYPNNKNVRAKIRQQLQVLRDTGFVRFDGQGKYSLLS